MNLNFRHYTACIAAAVCITPALAQTSLERRAEIEKEYGVKDAIVKYDTKADLMKELYRTGP